MFQREGIDFEVVSSAHLIEDEVTGEQNVIERLTPDAPLDEFSGLMFVSGNMKDTEAMWTAEDAQSLVAQAAGRDMPLAAICCSVPTIRNAASGKEVSFFPLVRSRELLEQAGAILKFTAVTVDGNLVTAEHQMATEMWAENFADVLLGREPRHVLHPSGYTPKSRPRRPMPFLEALKKAQTGAEGPKQCPECGKQTEIRWGRVVCPFGHGDFTTKTGLN